MKVLFICTANSCRSQMAEAWAGRLFPAGWEASSAGLLIYRITDRTRQVMAEVGLDMEGQKPKTIDVFDLNMFDLVVTLSKEATRYLPALRHRDRKLERIVDDPMAFQGDADATLEAFRQGRDRIRDIVASLVPSDFDSKSE